MIDTRPACPRCSNRWLPNGDCPLCGWSGETRSPDAKERRVQRGHAAPKFTADDERWRRLLRAAAAWASASEPDNDERNTS